MKSKVLVLTLLLLSSLLLLAQCGGGNTKPQIVFSHILNEQSEWHIGAAAWKEKVEKKLGDPITIRLVTNASLSSGNQRTELEMVQAGTLGGSWESSILLSIIDPRWTVWSMPWLFDSYEEAEKVCNSEAGQQMLKTLEEKGIIGLAYGFNGFRHLTNSKRPVASLQDISGLKVRVPSLQMFISLYRTWGADPSQMNFGDLVIALKEGAMDGQENPLHVIHSTGLYDIQKHLTQWQYSFDPLVFCISKRVWDRLSPEQQQAVREAAMEGTALQRQTVAQNEAQHLAFLKEKGMEVTVPSPEAIEAFKQASRPVYEEYKGTVGEDLLNQFIAAAGAKQ